MRKVDGVYDPFLMEMSLRKKKLMAHCNLHVCQMSCSDVMAQNPLNYSNYGVIHSAIFLELADKSFLFVMN